MKQSDFVQGEQSWFVIALPPLKQRERLVTDAIERGCQAASCFSDSITLYYPRYKVVHQTNIVEEELYPGYGFLGLSSNVDPAVFFDQFDDNVNYPIVLRKLVVSHDGCDMFVPAPIDTQVIYTIQQFCYQSFHGGKVKRKINFRPGDTVRIVSGTFNGFEGEVKSLNEERGVVFVEVFFLGTWVVIWTNVDDLVKEH